MTHTLTFCSDVRKIGSGSTMRLHVINVDGTATEAEAARQKFARLYRIKPDMIRVQANSPLAHCGVRS